MTDATFPESWPEDSLNHMPSRTYRRRQHDAARARFGDGRDTPAAPTTPQMPPQHCECGHELPCFDHAARSTPAEALDPALADILDEAAGEPWKPEGRIEDDDADGVWLANEDGDSLWLSSEDVARLLHHALRLRSPESD